jgi:hypothetical protein
MDGNLFVRKWEEAILQTFLLRTTPLSFLKNSPFFNFLNHAEENGRKEEGNPYSSFIN